jgi:4-phospho-D-threonate 3-dehydrogenase / 4-phospho-D-erythronate 3-dehydrogenase
MGDPSGIGPEIVVKALSKASLYKHCNPLIIGNARIIDKAVALCNLPLKVNPVKKVSDSRFQYGILDVLDIVNFIGEPEYGKVTAASGSAAFESVVKVIQLALNDEIDATVTAPINKEAINLAGHHFSGHTEIYAHFTNTKNYAMLLVYKNLRVIHVSTHTSLRQACDMVRKERILQVIGLLHDACRDFGIADPHIAVAGLNPHSGESGLFGWEEEREIVPAVAEALLSGYKVEGPIPADTMFSKALGGQYDGCVAMYHDQGHIPVKLLGFRWNKTLNRLEVRGVNITLGLPIIRVSVDHGTAFDLAGKGLASEESMSVSIDYAIKMAKNRIRDAGSNRR